MALSETDRICTRCNTCKPLSEYYYRKNRGTYESRCKECCREVCRSFNTPEIQRRKVLKTKYGITLETYNFMLKAQGGVCAICGQGEIVKNRTLAVDHCHKTGKVRQLLCGNCNQALGKFKDDPSLLLKAADYLNRHKED